MVDAVIQLIPTAKVGHIGLYRDPRLSRLWNITARCRRISTSGT
jgi:uracil phosphoribosyltransferase